MYAYATATPHFTKKKEQTTILMHLFCFDKLQLRKNGIISYIPYLHYIQFKKCKVCGNNDQGAFVLDRKNGDLICTNCGTIATESLMHEGSQFRKFEGEEDRNHHGDVANPLYSNAYNMGTSLSGVSMSVGAGMAGWGSGGRGAGGLETILKNIHNYTEMNISQFGKEEKKTRVGYKDRQKKVRVFSLHYIVHG